MSEPATIAKDYIAAWNETDSAARSLKLSDGWTPAASYADPVARADGLPAICDMIEGVHRRFPDFRFVLSGEPSGHGEFPPAPCGRARFPAGGGRGLACERV